MTYINETTMLAFRSELAKLAAPVPLASVGRFLGRQLHSVSGWTPKGGLAALRPASYSAMEEVQRLRGQLAGVPHWSPEATHLQGQLSTAEKGLGALQKAEGMGLSSIPGVFKAVHRYGAMPVLRAGAAAQWHGTSPGMKALMVGLPAAGIAAAALQKPPPGESRESGMGYQLGNLVGGIAGAPMPIIGSLAFGEGLGQLGRYAGKGVHKVRTMFNPAHGLHPNGPFPRQSTDLTTEAGQATPSETMMTARASGAGGFE